MLFLLFKVLWTYSDGNGVFLVQETLNTLPTKFLWVIKPSANQKKSEGGEEGGNQKKCPKLAGRKFLVECQKKGRAKAGRHFPVSLLQP